MIDNRKNGKYEFAQMLSLRIVHDAEHVNNFEYEKVPESHVTKNSKPSSVHASSTSSSGSSGANTSADINHWNNSPGAGVKNECEKPNNSEFEKVPESHMTKNSELSSSHAMSGSSGTLANAMADINRWYNSPSAGMKNKEPRSKLEVNVSCQHLVSTSHMYVSIVNPLPPPVQVQLLKEESMLGLVSLCVLSQLVLVHIRRMILYVFSAVSKSFVVSKSFSSALPFKLRPKVLALLCFAKLIPFAFSQLCNVLQTTPIMLCSANGTQIDYSESDHSYQWSSVVFVIPFYFLAAFIAKFLIKILCHQFYQLEAETEPITMKHSSQAISSLCHTHNVYLRSCALPVDVLKHRSSQSCLIEQEQYDTESSPYNNGESSLVNGQSSVSIQQYHAVSNEEAHFDKNGEPGTGESFCSSLRLLIFYRRMAPNFVVVNGPKMMFFLFFISNAFSSCQAQVNVYPSGRAVIALGGSFTFTCIHLNAGTNGDRVVNIQWMVNNTMLEKFNQSNVITQFSAVGNGVGTLTFIHLPLEYNGTTIRCEAAFHSGRITPSVEESSMVLVKVFSPGSRVAFVCPPTTTRHDNNQDIVWLLNGLPLTLNSNVHISGIGNFSVVVFSSLSIDLNGSIIQCRTLSKGHTLQYDIGALIVEALPVIDDLEVALDSDAISLSWSPPMSYGSVAYFVEVRDSDSSLLSAAITSKTHINYTVSADLAHCLVCGGCTFSVSAEATGVGMGPALSVLAEPPTGIVKPSMLSDWTTKPIGNNGTQVSLLVVPATCSATVAIQNVETGDFFHVLTLTITTTGINHSEVEFVVPTLRQGLFVLTFNLTNSAGTTMDELKLGQMDDTSMLRGNLVVILVVTLVLVGIMMVIQVTLILTMIVRMRRHKRCTPPKRSISEVESEVDASEMVASQAVDKESTKSSTCIATEQREQPKTAAFREFEPLERIRDGGITQFAATPPHLVNAVDATYPQGLSLLNDVDVISLQSLSSYGDYPSPTVCEDEAKIAHPKSELLHLPSEDETETTDQTETADQTKTADHGKENQLYVYSKQSTTSSIILLGGNVAKPATIHSSPSTTTQL